MKTQIRLHLVVLIAATTLMSACASSSAAQNFNNVATKAPSGTWYGEIMRQTVMVWGDIPPKSGVEQIGVMFADLQADHAGSISGFELWCGDVGTVSDTVARFPITGAADFMKGTITMSLWTTKDPLTASNDKQQWAGSFSGTNIHVTDVATSMNQEPTEGGGTISVETTTTVVAGLNLGSIDGFFNACKSDLKANN